MRQIRTEDRIATFQKKPLQPTTIPVVLGRISMCSCHHNTKHSPNPFPAAMYKPQINPSFHGHVSWVISNNKNGEEGVGSFTMSRYVESENYQHVRDQIFHP